jgi:hypothetical protein
MASVQEYSWTHLRSDPCHYEDDLRITTGTGRYVMGTPANGTNGVFVPEPTTRIQKWGGGQIVEKQKTDIESDLWNINRPGVRSVCGGYDPAKNKFNGLKPTPMPEASFPQNHSRLNDPPCTLKGTGFNRWEWLCQNPQENVMMPFDWFIPGRQLAKDSHRPCIPTPSNPTPSLPTPLQSWSDPYLSQTNTLSSKEEIKVVAPAPQFSWVSPKSEIACPVPVGPPSIAWKRDGRDDTHYPASLPRTMQ